MMDGIKFLGKEENVLFSQTIGFPEKLAFKDNALEGELWGGLEQLGENSREVCL